LRGVGNAVDAGGDLHLGRLAALLGGDPVFAGRRRLALRVHAIPAEVGGTTGACLDDEAAHELPTRGPHFHRHRTGDFGRHAATHAGFALKGCDVGVDIGTATDHGGRLQGLRLAEHQAQVLQPAVHLFDALDGGELRHLSDELALLHRLQRVLVLQLFGHQSQEVLLP
jgi:hypothetical protein